MKYHCTELAPTPRVAGDADKGLCERLLLPCSAWAGGCLRVLSWVPLADAFVWDASADVGTVNKVSLVSGAGLAVVSTASQ